MRSYRLLGRGCDHVRPQLWTSRQPSQLFALKLNGSRGFRTSSTSYLRKGANDDPEDYFEHSFTKRAHDDLASAKVADARPKVKSLPRAVPLAAPFSEQAKGLADSFGFLFDCDGVLYAGNHKIDSAKAALSLCRHQRARYLFLTNGGGNTTEDQKAASLVKKVGLDDQELVDGRVIQSHTPLSTFKEDVKRDETIYITSLDPGRARDIAHAYGFKKVVTADDIVEQYEHIYPFRPKRFAYGNVEPFPDGARIWRGRPPMKYDEAELKGGNYLKIDHVFVFNDPRDWSLETQIIYDLLISHKGYLGTMSRQNGNQALENDGWQQDGQPTVWVSNLDLLWKTEHPINRFGTGAFVHAFRGVWHEATGRELQFKYMGKPSQITYEYAHECLLREDASSSPGQNGAAAGRPLRRVYMIGDNPESDVRGALEFKPEDGTEYVPILVKTGVWHETEPGAQPRWQPAVIVDDVLDAVVWAMREEGIDIDRNTAEQHIQRGA